MNCAYCEKSVCLKYKILTLSIHLVSIYRCTIYKYKYSSHRHLYTEAVPSLRAESSACPPSWQTSHPYDSEPCQAHNKPSKTQLAAAIMYIA